MSKSTTPSVEQLKRALSLAEQIKRLEAELASLFKNGDAASARAALGQQKAVLAKVSKSSGSGRRTLSPEAREKIAAAQRRRWAKSKGAKGASGAAKSTASAVKVTSKSSVSGKRKRALTPRGRARIAEAARRRWAVYRKGR